MIRIRKKSLTDTPTGTAVKFRRGGRRFCPALILTVLLVSVPSLAWPMSATADDWMFGRSYYSHRVPEELRDAWPRPESRSAYRRPYLGTTPGFSISGGYRINRTFLRSGNSTDLTVYRQDWVREWP